MEVAVVGNITLDILCYPVDIVPRYNSLSFEKAYVGPGGCGSNVVIGLSALGVDAALIGVVGDDPSAKLIKIFWEKYRINSQYVRCKSNTSTGVSVGLIDSEAQPRFIHTSGANKYLVPRDIRIEELRQDDLKWLHIAGYFVLPGLLDESLGKVIKRAHEVGIKTSLDVVDSHLMDNPDVLWSFISNIDYFLCNEHEAKKLTGKGDPIQASIVLRKRGGKTVIIKRGANGCIVNEENNIKQIPVSRVTAIDTTGAGDAFAAALIKSLLDEKNVQQACKDANDAGAHITTEFGAITAWSKADGY